VRAVGALAAALLLAATTHAGGVPRPAGAGAVRAAEAARLTCDTRTGADYNGDGYPDLAVGDPNAHFRKPGAGSVHVLLGTEEGFPRVDAADALLTSARAPAAMRLADVDGDGCADLVVGSPHAERNRAVIYWGGRGARPAFAQVDATALPVDAGAGANAGWSVAAAEGVVAVGAPYEDVGGVRRAGAVHVFTVGPGRKVTKALRITQDTPGVPGVAEPGDMFGWSLALGRLGGDPDALDLVIGAPYEDIEAGAGRDAGAITIVYDVTRRGGGGLRAVSRRLDGADDGLPDRAGDRFGHALAYGEWGGLGYLAASAPGADVGDAADAGVVRLYESGGKAGPRAVRLLRQGAGGLPDAPERGDEFGHALGFAGGHLLVGAPFEAVRGLPEAGAVTVVPLDGGPGSFVTEGRVRIQAYDHFGWSVTGVGEEWMAVGVPDEQATHGGAVALVRLLGEGVHRDVHLLAPGFKGIPHLPHAGDRPRSREIAASVDFGAVVTG